MTDWDGFQARVAPGAGIVARTAGGALLIPAAAAQEPIVEQLLGLIRDAGPEGGRALARKLAAVLATADNAESLELALLAPLTGGDLAVLVVGDIEVSAETAEGAIVISGREALTWVDRVLRAPTRVQVTPGAGAADVLAGTDLVAGVVPGGALNFTPRGTSPQIAPAPVIEPALAAPDFEVASLVKDVEPARAPLPVEPVEQPLAASSEPSPGFVSAPPRPSLGVLVFDDGAIYQLDQDYVLGRQPEGAVEVVSGSASPLRIDDSGGTVSRAHALISVDGWTVRVSDHGSANGTYIALPNSPDWQAVPANGRVVLAPGTTIKLGDRTLRYESYPGQS